MVSPRKRKPVGTGSDAERGLLELENVKIAAMALHEALRSKHFQKFPSQAYVWESFRSYHALVVWSQAAVAGLLVLSVFEMPMWCRSQDFAANPWSWRNAEKACADVYGDASAELLMSGVPLLPWGISLCIEVSLLSVILARILVTATLHRHFRSVGGEYRSSALMILDYVMIMLSFSDAAYVGLFPDSRVRIAPFLRFGLAISIPFIASIVEAFLKVTRAMASIGLVLVGTVLLWAWLGACIFDDISVKDQLGLAVNSGLESFSKSMYTMFATMTTAVLPDVIVPTYAYDPAYLLFWTPFILFACCIFSQVILATVYSNYGSITGTRMKLGLENRLKGIKVAFHYLKSSVKNPETGATEEVVFFETFRQLAMAMRAIDPNVLDPEHIALAFEAIDDDRSETLSLREFHDMSELLQTTFTLTRRDSLVRMYLEGTGAGRVLEWLMSNHVEGLDFGSAPPPWTPSKFVGSPFDRLMTVVVCANVAWLLTESIFDLNDIVEPSIFLSGDLVFSFVYVVEVAMKLSWWSWQEYWISKDNRFDFVTSLVFASIGLTFLFADLGKQVMRYVNLLRLVRLFKALKSLPEFEQTMTTISTMLTTSRDVLLMNMLIIYLWSAAGLQLFGGRLYESNPDLHEEGLGYFSNKEQIFNFNDMIFAMVTMFFVTISSWNHSFYTVCLALYEPFSINWFFASMFWLTYYIGSHLVAWNVVSAFSIDVFMKLSAMNEVSGEDLKTEIERNLEKKQLEYLAEGVCLRIRASSHLLRERVYQELYEQQFASVDNEFDEDTIRDDDFVLLGVPPKA